VQHFAVTARLVPAIYALSCEPSKGVDGRARPGHDGDTTGAFACFSEHGTCSVDHRAVNAV
jgi:hypothetical protein